MNKPNEDIRIGIIGCGNMGEAIARTIISAKVLPRANLYLYDIEGDKSRYLKKALNANHTHSAVEIVNSCNTVVIAVKPQDIDVLLKKTSSAVDKTKLIISIAAGVTIRRIKKFLPEGARIVRVMPNMAALVGKSISALCYGRFVTDEDKELAKKIFGALGDTVEVEESQMDAVTAISGSGPAYFFYMVEILQKCAVEMGIETSKAKRLAIKTLVGSAALLGNGEDEAKKLRERVTSKGGTTEAAFRVFDERGLAGIFREGITAAAKRAEELSGGGR